MSALAGEGHIPSALSIVDILYVLYRDVLPGPTDLEKGSSAPLFILSKGHGSLALYQCLASVGFVSQAQIDSFCDFGSILGGHPDRTKVPGVAASTGSLGHGLAMGVGIALARKARAATGSVIVLIGDGEANEGSVWEAALVAGHHRLGNLICIVDNNRSTARAISMGSFEKKFEAFGWSTRTIDGHSESEISEAFRTPSRGLPLAVIANTVKGQGVPRMESNPEWHHKAPSTQDLPRLLEELR